MDVRGPLGVAADRLEHAADRAVGRGSGSWPARRCGTRSGPSASVVNRPRALPAALARLLDVVEARRRRPARRRARRAGDRRAADVQRPGRGRRTARRCPPRSRCRRPVGVARRARPRRTARAPSTRSPPLGLRWLMASTSIDTPEHVRQQDELLPLVVALLPGRGQELDRRPATPPRSARPRARTRAGGGPGTVSTSRSRGSAQPAMRAMTASVALCSLNSRIPACSPRARPAR